MVRRLFLSKRFEKSYSKFVRNNPHLVNSISRALLILEENPYSSIVSVHKLSGKLFGLFACSCGYNCRIVYQIEKYNNPEEEHIILLDIGTHDEVY